METRIFNTTFNGLNSDTPIGQKIDLVVSAMNKYNGGTYGIYNSLYPNLYNSDINLNNSEILNNYLLNKNGIKFYFSLSANRTLKWTEDFPQDAAGIIQTFNLTDAVTGITDNITIPFSFVTTPVTPATALGFNVYLGTAGDPTTDNITFENLASGGPSYRAILFKNTDTPMTIQVNIKATDFTPGDEKIAFTWTN